MYSLEVLESLNKQKGTGATVDEFHRQINVIFHDVESEVYDDIHSGMSRTLPREFFRLIQDLPADFLARASALRLLDVGCGTGLGTDILLTSPIGKRVTDITLIDTSSRMITACRRRFRHRSIHMRWVTGEIADLLPTDGSFDVILTCSVLHHIPDLQGFFEVLCNLQSPGGVFLHLQDPNAQANYEVLQERKNELRQECEGRSTLNQYRTFGKRIKMGVRRRLNRVLGRSSIGYMERVNEILLQNSVIRCPLTDQEVWMITDIHDRQGGGVSIAAVRSWLKEYDLVSWHSYSFFGRLRSELPRKLRHREDRLADARDYNGETIAGAWRKVNTSVS